MYLLPPDKTMRDVQRMDEELAAAFEERAYMGWEEPGNDGVDRTPERVDLLTERMEAENYESFDEDGWVR